MAAGTFTVLDIAKKKLVDGTFDLDTHTFKAALVTNVQALAASFAGTSTDGRYADLTAQVASGNGYTTGGATLTGVTLNRSGATVTFTSSAPSWSNATFTAKYVVVYDDSDANKGILGFMDLETGNGSGVSPSNGTLTVNWNASGMFTLN
ncbi:hypothetical protein ACLBV5_09625 [Brevundimonas sp. M1A4_2e]